MQQESRIRDIPTGGKPAGPSAAPLTHIAINWSSLEFPANLTVLEAVENAGVCFRHYVTTPA